MEAAVVRVRPVILTLSASLSVSVSELIAGQAEAEHAREDDDGGDSKKGERERQLFLQKPKASRGNRKEEGEGVL